MDSTLFMSLIISCIVEAIFILSFVDWSATFVDLAMALEVALIFSSTSSEI